MAASECITIPLSRGYFTIVNPEDASLATQKWCALVNPRGEVYAFHSRPSTYLHRVIMERKQGRELVKGEHVDHVNGDRLDNRRENLRLASHTQNMWNSKKPKGNSTGFKGVVRHQGRFQAQIKVNGKYVYLGMFDTPEQAHEAYCEAAIKYHGEFARLE